MNEIKELEIAEDEAENHHSQNHAHELRRAHSITQRSIPRLAQLLPYGKYAGQTEGTGRMAAQSIKVLHLVRQLTEKKPERKRKNLIQLGSTRIMPINGAVCEISVAIHEFIFL